MNPRPTAKEIAQDALKSGALRVKESLSFETPNGATLAEIKGNYNANGFKVKLPSEVGLQAIPPTPKPDGRTREALGLRPFRKDNRKRYVLTKSQLLAQRPNLKLP